MRHLKLMLLLVLAACGRDVAPPPETSPGPVDGQSFWVRQEGKPRVIIFVHGILGNPRGTWTNTETGAFFPDLLKADAAFSDADIYVQGYESPALGKSYDVDQLAEKLFRDFARDKVSDYREILFVCHSMGGLATRAYLLKYRDVVPKVPMIYFYSTPSTRGSLAAFAAKLSKNPQFDNMTDIADNTYLSSQQSSWLAAGFQNRIKSFCAYELKETYGAVIVDQGSATNLCTQRLDPILANHIDIVKPGDDLADPAGVEAC